VFSKPERKKTSKAVNLHSCFEGTGERRTIESFSVAASFFIFKELKLN
jgi:hypothetical protein